MISQSSVAYPIIDNSLHLLERAKDLIPGCSQTLAKGPTQYVKGIAPHYLQRGDGAYVWDVDGNKYLDFTMAVGPLSLGYKHPVVDSAITAQLDNGITFSMMHPLEVEVAELIREVVPNVESVRYSKTGADATSAAIRLARAYTGKSKVLCCGYHGWHDWYISVTDRNTGIPHAVSQLSYTFEYNDYNGLAESIDDDIAAIILEPFVVQRPNNEFLQSIRTLCDNHNIVLIFDEMWTGFRIALGGAQEYFGIRADLICFSKAIANGMPLSVLCGRKDIMSLLEHNVFFYTTFGGEALSLAAAKATITFMKENPVFESFETNGSMLRDRLNNILGNSEAGFLNCIGYPCRTMLHIQSGKYSGNLIKSIIQQELFRYGILWGGFHNLSYSHTPSDIQLLLDAYSEIIPFVVHEYNNGTLQNVLQGEEIAPVFRKVSQFNTKPKKNT